MKTKNKANNSNNRQTPFFKCNRRMERQKETLSGPKCSCSHLPSQPNKQAIFEMEKAPENREDIFEATVSTIVRLKQLAFSSRRPRLLGRFTDMAAAFTFNGTPQVTKTNELMNSKTLPLSKVKPSWLYFGSEFVNW